MSEDHNINLPADFDDLSKHAPLLAALRPQADGFVVPENYFKELAGQIISLLSLPAGENPFTVPANYFENLSEELTSIIQSLDSIGNRKPETGNPFSLPESYFNELDETISTKLALDNLKQDEGFAVPGNYFENFTDKLLTQVNVDELKNGSDADVPAGYFDTLADRVAARIAEEEGTKPGENTERVRIIVFTEVIKRFAKPVSLAASVALLLAVSIWFFNRSDAPEKDKIVKTVPVKKQPVIPQVIPPVKDTAVANENLAVQPEIKKKPKVNLPDKVVVKGTDKPIDQKDIIEELYLMDENMVADYITDDAVEDVSPEGSLNDEMLDYLINNDADPTDIHK